MPIFGNNILAGASGQSTGVDVGDYSGKSILFDHITSNNTSISRTSDSGDGNRKMWTQSVWVKKLTNGSGSHHCFCTPVDNGDNSGIASLYFDANDKLEHYHDENPSSGREYGNTDINDRVYRDPSAWYHIIWTVDAANTVQKVYVNGVEETIGAGSTNHPMNVDYNINKGSSLHRIGIEGWDGDGATTYTNQFMIANFVHLDGTYMANVAAFEDKLGRFSEDTGEWVCIDPVNVSYGTHGFWLKFDDNTNDSSGLSHNFTNNNSCPFLEDTPVNNFCTMNPLDNDHDALMTNSKGNNYVVWDTNDYDRQRASMAMTSGKWYFEFRQESTNTGNTVVWGVKTTNAALTDDSGIGSGSAMADEWILTDAGYIANNGGGTDVSSSITDVTTVGDIVQVAVDMDNKKIWFGINGTFDGDPAAGSGNRYSNLPSSVSPMVGIGGGATVRGAHANFGSSTFTISSPNADGNGYGSFEHAPPSGFLALCSKNMPEIEIGQEEDDLATDYFNTVLYTGNGTAIGSGGLAVTGVGFSPDFTWIKGRSSSGLNHMQFDSVRGVTKRLYSDGTGAESTDAETLTAFGADGFTLGNSGNVNGSSVTYASWNWLAGEAIGTGDFTQGTIASTGQRNTDAGFSIVSYTGTASAGTVGHGLSQTPEMIIVKNRADTSSYLVRNHNLAVNLTLLLENTTAPIGTDYWNTSSETRNATVFSVSSNNEVNGSSDAMIAYCWHGVEGYSKIGSYTGNGNADGTFVHCGFKPAFVMTKRSDSTSQWGIWDNKRSTNPNDETLYANTTDGTVGSEDMDFLSNGFKLRNSNADPANASGGSYVFMAFAETPFKYATGN